MNAEAIMTPGGIAAGFQGLVNAAMHLPGQMQQVQNEQRSVENDRMRMDMAFKRDQMNDAFRQRNMDEDSHFRQAQLDLENKRFAAQQTASDLHRQVTLAELAAKKQGMELAVRQDRRERLTDLSQLRGSPRIPDVEETQTYARAAKKADMADAFTGERIKTEQARQKAYAMPRPGSDPTLKASGQLQRLLDSRTRLIGNVALQTMDPAGYARQLADYDAMIDLLRTQYTPLDRPAGNQPAAPTVDPAFEGLPQLPD